MDIHFLCSTDYSIWNTTNVRVIRQSASLGHIGALLCADQYIIYMENEEKT